MNTYSNVKTQPVQTIRGARPLKTAYLRKQKEKSFLRLSSRDLSVIKPKKAKIYRTQTARQRIPDWK